MNGFTSDWIVRWSASLRMLRAGVVPVFDAPTSNSLRTVENAQILNRARNFYHG